MSNYKGIHLIEFVRSTCRIYPEFPNIYIGRKICTSRCCRVRSEQDCEQGNKDNGREHDKSGNSSRFHQNYHRKSYEKKREYQNERNHGYRDNSQTTSSMLNSSFTHYHRLNVDSSANLDKIKSAYYSLSKQYHPDIVGKDDPVAIENFRLITDAYDTLSDPKLKADYDKQIQIDFEPSSDSVFTSWQPRGQNYQNQETVFRMRETHRIFQSKQDEALAREKERNPNKFRSGVFKQDIPDIETDRRRLQDHIRHVNSLEAKISGGAFKRSDGNEFYRAHLYGTLIRKQQDLNEHQPGTGIISDELLLISLATIVGVLALFLLTAADAVYDIDIAKFLDGKLETKVKGSNHVKREH